MPGPGTYDLNNATMISPQGSYFVSKFRSSLCRTFGKNTRKGHSNSVSHFGKPFLFNI